MTPTRIAATLLAVALAACGDDADSVSTSGSTETSGTETTGAPAGGPGSISAASGDAPSGAGGGDGGSGSVATGPSAVASGGVGGGTGDWQPLITANWLLAPGDESTSGISATVADRDMYIGAIRPIAPFGTHHTIVALGDFSTANYIYASGVETNAIEFPPGVGLKISAGQSIILQLHIFNPSAETLNATSGIEVIELSPEDVEQEADIFLPGPIGLSIPPNQETTIGNDCVLTEPQTIFALFPHMHQLGAHFKTTIHQGASSTILHDDAYDFEHQPFLSFEPIALQPGDSVATECTWNNTTAQEVGWGESSDSEMCFSILYRWPAQSGESFCP